MNSGLDEFASQLKHIEENLKDFKPTPYYDPLTNSILYYFKDEPSREKQISEYLTLFLSNEDDSLVGIELTCYIPYKITKAEFLNKVYGFQRDNKIREGIDYIFQIFSDLLSKGNLQYCDDILAEVDVTKLKTDLLLSFFTITFWNNDLLPSRRNYYLRAKKVIRKDVGWLESRRLLKNVFPTKSDFSIIIKESLGAAKLPTNTTKNQLVDRYSSQTDFSEV